MSGSAALNGLVVTAIADTPQQNAMRLLGYNRTNEVMIFGDSAQSSVDVGEPPDSTIGVNTGTVTTIPLAPPVTKNAGITILTFTPLHFIDFPYYDMFGDLTFDAIAQLWGNAFGASGNGSVCSYDMTGNVSTAYLFNPAPLTVATKSFTNAMMLKPPLSTPDDLIGRTNEGSPTIEIIWQKSIQDFSTYSRTVFTVTSTSAALRNPIRGGGNVPPYFFYDLNATGFSGSQIIRKLNTDTGTETTLMATVTPYRYAMLLSRAGALWTLRFSTSVLDKRDTDFNIVFSTSAFSFAAGNSQPAIFEDNNGYIWVTNCASGITLYTGNFVETLVAAAQAGVVSQWFKLDPATGSVIGEFIFRNKGHVNLLGFDANNNPVGMSFRTADADSANKHVVFYGVR